MVCSDNILCHYLCIIHADYSITAHTSDLQTGAYSAASQMLTLNLIDTEIGLDQSCTDGRAMQTLTQMTCMPSMPTAKSGAGSGLSFPNG